jgi:branched-chain amino acid transport system permease protein
MNYFFLLEQVLNGLQLGFMLFLMAAGLTLIFGIMDVINLSHGSIYMLGAYLMATFTELTGNFLLSIPLAIVATAMIGMILEIILFRRLYTRDHLAQVLATFGLILCLGDLAKMLWGPHQISVRIPSEWAGSVNLFSDFNYSQYRFAIIAIGLIVAIGLFLFIHKTKIGMWIRAGASNREMAMMMGVNIKRLFTLVFGLGAALCALAGAALGPLLSISVDMGSNMIILTFVVIVIGGIGSIKGALVGAMLIGVIDTLGRAMLPNLLREIIKPEYADSLGSADASILIYILMAFILSWKPQGIFSTRG